MNTKNIAHEYFWDLLGNYCPDYIEEIFDKFGKELIDRPLLPRYIFNDGSYIEVYGGEIANVNGKSE